MKIKTILFILLLLIAGCAQTKTNVVIIGESEELQNVQEVFRSIESKEDKLLIYKLFAGAGEYLNNCKNMDNTSKFDPILGRVQSSYGWDREKYPEFTDAVSEYLISVGYDEPKQLNNSKDRKDFAKIFQDLAEATKHE